MSHLPWGLIASTSVELLLVGLCLYELYKLKRK
jgi:hypothetical protein